MFVITAALVSGSEYPSSLQTLRKITGKIPPEETPKLTYRRSTAKLTLAHSVNAVIYKVRDKEKKAVVKPQIDF